MNIKFVIVRVNNTESEVLSALKFILHHDFILKRRFKKQKEEESLNCLWPGLLNDAVQCGSNKNKNLVVERRKLESEVVDK